jgi:hypothetical protein
MQFEFSRQFPKYIYGLVHFPVYQYLSVHFFVAINQNGKYIHL